MEELKYILRQQQEFIEKLSEHINEQNVKLNKMYKLIKSIETKVSQQSERDANKVIRQYALKGTKGDAVPFMPSKSISELLND